MNQKQFSNALAERSGLASATANVLTESLARVLAEYGAALDAVAIPGFGTFTTEKVDEHVVTDSATGVRTLLPPEIKMDFKPSILLRKKL